MKHNLTKPDNYLLIVDDDSEIKIGDWVIENTINQIFEINDINKSIGLCRSKVDTYVIDSCRKIISHAPLNGAPYLDGVDVLPPSWRDSGEEESETNFAEVFYRLLKNTYPTFEEWPEAIEYRKQSREKYKYTEQDVRAIKRILIYDDDKNDAEKITEVIRVIESRQQPKYPIAFECEMIRVYDVYPQRTEYKPKTFTNSEGRIEWVGKYIYE